MTTYVALLRGIGPGNPNMRNDKLRELFESLGFDDVRSVISSGNVVFSSDRTDIKQMETEAEAAFPRRLGYTCTTVIRSQAQLERLIKADPFHGLEHGPGSYLMATFFKHPVQVPFDLPHQPGNKPYRLLSVHDNTLFTSTDNTVLTTTDLMGFLEKNFSKAITSRTWKTVHRIVSKMSEEP